MKKILLLAVLVLALGAQTVLAVSLEDRKFLSEISAAELQAAVDAARGKTVLLNFFASWCPPCKEELPDLIKLRKDVSPDKLVIIAVSVGDSLDAMERMAQKYEFNFPTFMGTHDVSTTYGITAIPHNVVISPEGRIEYSDSGIIDTDTVREYAAKASSR